MEVTFLAWIAEKFDAIEPNTKQEYIDILEDNGYDIDDTGDLFDEYTDFCAESGSIVDMPDFLENYV